MLATYCVCQEFCFDYVHTPLAKIEYQGLQSLLSQRNSDAFVTECNARMAKCIASSDAVPKSADAISAKYERIEADLSLEQLEQLKRRLAERKRAAALSGSGGGSGGGGVRTRALVCFSFPFVIADAHPRVYRHARGLWTRGSGSGGGGSGDSSGGSSGGFTPLVIGLHVRRGELFLVDSDRMLPNEFYLDMASRVIAACDALGVEYVVELYSEVAKAPTTVTQFPGTGKRLAAPATYQPNGAEALHDFDVLEPRLRRCVNEPLLQTFDRMVACDVLVMSRSSLSACAAYLKPASALVLYHPFWHNMLEVEDGHIPCNDPMLDARCRSFVKKFKAAAGGGSNKPNNMR